MKASFIVFSTFSIILVTLTVFSLILLFHSFIFVGSFKLAGNASFHYESNSVLVVYSSGFSRVLYDGVIEAVLLNESIPFPPGSIEVTPISNSTISVWIQTGYFLTSIKLLFASFFLGFGMILGCIGFGDELAGPCFLSAVSTLFIFIILSIVMIAPSILGFPPNYHSYRVKFNNSTYNTIFP